MVRDPFKLELFENGDAISARFAAAPPASSWHESEFARSVIVAEEIVLVLVLVDLEVFPARSTL